MPDERVFSERCRLIPPVEPGRRNAVAENLERRTHDQLLAMVPEINLLEVHSEHSAEPAEAQRVLVWNGERGRFVLERSPLPPADVYLLNEMDAGMARTENAHTARRLAETLGLNYFFAVEFLELTKGEPQERLVPGTNSFSYHGNAILTRFEIQEPRLLRLDGGAAWLDDEQKRLGSRIALICRVETVRGVVRLVCTHLESEAPPSLRLFQMRQLLEYLEKEEPGIPTVLGGDLNTWSFDKRSKAEQGRLAGDPETPARLLSPMAWEPLFEELAAHGYRWEETNDLSRGTYPLPEVSVEARLDWILVRGLHGSEPRVVPAPFSQRLGRSVSDHHAVAARVEIVS